MTNEEKLSKALREFQNKYPSTTSGDLQTFIIGWKEAMKSQIIPKHKCIIKNIFQFWTDKEMRIPLISYIVMIIIFILTLLYGFLIYK